MTSTDGPATYAKIIGDNHGSYPYRIGLNTLAHNDETFDAEPECRPGGLYYCKIKDVFAWLNYGDTLCIVKPVGQIVAVENKFKTDKLEIVEMMSLHDLDTWKFLVEHGANVRACDDLAVRNATYRGLLDVVKFLGEKGANIHADEEDALRLAVTARNLEIVGFLLERGAKVNTLDRYDKYWISLYFDDIVENSSDDDSDEHYSDY